MFKNKKLMEIESIIIGNGGIERKIDINRKLLELILDENPGLLKTHPWVTSWIGEHERFYHELTTAADITPDYEKIREWPHTNKRMSI